MGLNDCLIPSHLVSRSQLNEWEQQNIEAALLWLARQRQLRPLEEDWLRRLHREMFGQTWRWAGPYRCSDKSLGAHWRQIRMQLPALLADVLIEQLGAPRFSWGGSSSLIDPTALRQSCIDALQKADRGDLSALLTFARAS